MLRSITRAFTYIKEHSIYPNFSAATARSSFRRRARQGGSIKRDTASRWQRALGVRVLTLRDDEVHVGVHVKADHVLVEGLSKAARLQIEAKQSLEHESVNI